ncbi:MAG: hypothetical protein JSU69_11980 [Candidatus Zixiibacteriota bacterium]|nr:MAG: hypothetical protein JSU69_11980 [candidate division Zixibacteria bacterium]
MSKTLRFRILLTAIFMLIIFGTAISAYGWDKQRKGFILGVGMGPGFSSFTEKTDSSGTEIFSSDKSKFAFFSDFKMGYAPNNKLMIYWLSKGAWAGTDTSAIDPEQEDVTTLAGVGGLGITYFFRPEAPSLFVTTGVGFAAWSLPFKDSDSWTGFGFAGGLGYEFATNWNIAASLLWGKSKSDETFQNSEVDNLAFGLTINVIGY